MIREWALRFKKPMVLGVLAAVATACVVIFFPNRYASEARILPVESKSLAGSLGGLAATAAAFGVAIPNSDGNDANFVDILQSRTIKEALLLTNYRFHQRTWRFGQDRECTESLQTYLHQKNLDRGVLVLSNFYSVSRDLKSKIIVIRAETRSPELSQAIVRKAINLLETFVREKGRTRGGAKALFAEARLQEARKEAATAEEEFRRFLDGNRNYLVSSDPSIRLRGARLEAELKLRQQLVMTLAVNREQALMDEKNDIPILNTLDPGNLPVEKSGPVRSLMVLAALLAGFFGTLAWMHREWIMNCLISAETQRSL